MNPLAATLAISAGSWEEAAEIYQHLLGQGPLPSNTDYHACAYVYERLARWDVHESIVQAGLKVFPGDKVLQARQRYNQAMRCIGREDWDGAWQILEFLRLNPAPSAWPYAIRYHRWQVRFARELLGLTDPQARLNKIDAYQLFKSTDIFPERIAGILYAVDALPWDRALRKGFAEHAALLIECLKNHDARIRLIDDVSLNQGIARMAGFWRANIGAMQGLPCGYYEFFARLFLCRGYLKLYAQLRKLFVAHLALTQIGAREQVGFAYQVALANEQGDINTYKRLVQQAEQLEDDARPALMNYLHLSSFYYAQQVLTCLVKMDDVAFYEYIRGKTVAIVGPVDVGLDSGAEIDSFDVVVRFNYRHGLGYAASKFGAKTNMSYYLQAVLPEVPPLELAEAMQQLEFAVIDEVSLRSRSWFTALNVRVRQRLALVGYLDNPLLIGYAGAVQRVLFDILRFQPQRVKVFAADLFTGMSYRSEYLVHSSLGKNGGNIFPGLSLHDPVSNFLLMQRFVQSSRVEVDAVLAQVLALNEDEYIERLQDCHDKFIATAH
jgi:hypothetical protein